MPGSAKYPEMKDSNIPWIGSIPSSWNIVRAKSILKNVTEKGHPDAEDIRKAVEFYEGLK